MLNFFIKHYTWKKTIYSLVNLTYMIYKVFKFYTKIYHYRYFIYTYLLFYDVMKKIDSFSSHSIACSSFHVLFWEFISVKRSPTLFLKLIFHFNSTPFLIYSKYFFVKDTFFRPDREQSKFLCSIPFVLICSNQTGQKIFRLICNNEFDNSLFQINGWHSCTFYILK